MSSTLATWSRASGATPRNRGASALPVPSPEAIEATWVPWPLSSYGCSLQVPVKIANEVLKRPQFAGAAANRLVNELLVRRLNAGVDDADFDAGAVVPIVEVDVLGSEISPCRLQKRRGARVLLDAEYFVDLGQAARLGGAHRGGKG